MTIVWPYSSTERRSSFSISSEVAESRLPVGSSAKSTAGREMSPRASATRCCSPPESSEGRCRRRPPRPTEETSDPSHSGSIRRPAIVIGSSRFSSAVSIGRRLKNWKTKPTFSRRSSVSGLSLRVVISVPSMVTLPDVGASRPARMFISVDLPEPDGPITAANWPFGKSTVTPRRASTAAPPVP